MNFNLSKIFNRKNIPEIVLAIVSGLYVLGDIKTPQSVSGVVNTHLGIFVLVAISIMVGYHTHGVVSVIVIFALYELYRRSREHPVQKMEDRMPKDKRASELGPQNQFPVTLEEQVVKKMAPWVLHENTTPASYKPVLDSDSGGTEL